MGIESQEPKTDLVGYRTGPLHHTVPASQSCLQASHGAQVSERCTVR